MHCDMLSDEKVPAGHGICVADPVPHCDPAGHCLQPLTSVAASAADHVPAGHGTALAVPRPQ
jgi:hypothetical protein